MEKVILHPVDYQWDQEFYKPGGISQTVPNEATDLKELVLRAMAHGTLPEIARGLDDGPDEDFDDAYEPGQDLADYCETKEYIERYSEALKAAKVAEEAKKKANEARKQPEGTSDPLENESV